MNEASKDNLFPLSLSQLNILNLERSLPGTSVNNISTTIRINGCVDFTLLQNSINLVIESDPSLRIQLLNVDGTMMQHSTPFVREEFPVYDFSNMSSEGIGNWEVAITREIIPLEGRPLYRFILFRDSERTGGILVKLHHIIADGWSQIMICNKIAKTYLKLLSHKEPSLEKAPDYQIHIQEENDYISSKAFERDEKYWKSIVDRIEEPSSLKNIYGATVSPVGNRVSFELPQVLNHAVFSFCQEKRVAPFAVFYMALAIYFKRNGGADRFTIGVPIFNRTSYEFKQSTGMFVTTLPFYNEIDDSWTLNSFNDDLMEKWYEMLRHQRYPFSKICDLSQKGGRLFNIALSYQDSKIFESRDASVHFSGRWHYCGYQAEQLTIHVTNLKNHQQYAIDYDYLAQYFTEDEIVALHKNLCHIIYEALNEPNKPIHALNILSLEEKEQVLYTFNKTDKYLEDNSVYNTLLQNSRDHLNRAAIIYNGERMTYGALLHRSSQFACAISETVKDNNALVAIMLPRSFDLPAAMIGVLQQKCAYLLLSASLPKERIKKILIQSEASLLITDDRFISVVNECNIPVITADNVDDYYGLPANCDECNCMKTDELLAYVVYTSGSTGEPKGVEITQQNLLNLAQEMEPIYGSGAVLSVCNVGFDAFMLESIVALLNGRTVVFPSDLDIESPDRLAELITGYAVGFFAMTPSRLSVMLSSKAFKKAMSRIDSVVCGGEHFSTELLRKLKSCTNARIYNQYGPSETTVAVSMKELSRADKITVGAPLGNCKMYVLDQWLNPMPIGGQGRLFVGGKCVGRGYRNRPDITEKYFRKNPFINDDRIYDTGDIANWTPGGELVLVGRADSQVKIHGLRIELQEISSCVESFPGIIGAYAKVCNLNGTDFLVVYYSSEYQIRESDLISHLATYLPDYMIPSFFISVPFLPVTSNGKIDESALPLPSVSSEEYRGALSEESSVILEVFKKVLNNPDLQVTSDYFKNGGNSLNAMQCIMEIEEQLSRKIRISDLYAYRTALRLSEYINGEFVISNAFEYAQTNSPKSLVKKEKNSEYMLTGIQQGIYIQSVIDKNGLSYNMPGAFKMERMPDIGLLERSFVSLVDDDPIFRTIFVQGENGIVARILDKVEFKLETVEGESFEQAAADFIRPFDLTRAPLLRAGIWVSVDGDCFLFIDSHHIIGDGISSSIILQRLDRAYRSEKIKVEWDFYDYLNFVKDKKGEDISLTDYWKEHLSGLTEKLELCGDYSLRPKKFDYKGRDCEVLFNEKESRACEAFCKNNGISEYVLFLSAFGLLLSAASGNKDFVIGTPVSGRTVTETENICGPFINTLPLRLNIDTDISVADLLSSVRNEVASLLDHQNITLEELLNILGLPRGDQNALYQIMFTQSPVDITSFSLGGSKMDFVPLSTGSVKMDMIVELSRKGSCVVLNFSYATGLFSEETVMFYGRCMKNIVKEFVAHSDKKLSDIRLMSPSDQEILIETPNYCVTPFINSPIHRILKNTAERNGDKTAVIFHGEDISFSQLEYRANQIASFIMSKGIQPGSCIAIFMKRTPDLIAAMYGILKAGCSYMFLLATFPEARIRYMLSVSSAALVLYDSYIVIPDQFKNGGLGVDFCMLPTDGPADDCDVRVKDSSSVNVLFTSGSTGQPKGIMLSHRSMCNLYSQMREMLSSFEGNVLCSTNSVFDCFVVETLIALALGRTVVLADDEEMMLPWKLASLIEKYEVGVVEMTPTRFNVCLNNDEFRSASENIKVVLLGGEVVTDALLNKFSDCSDGVLMNMYGPTEATVFTTAEALKKGEHITIGRPLQNTRVYVLDENRKPVLPTACGELYIAGECLSLGYVGRDDLTESSFFDDIYFPGEKMYRSGDIVRLRTDGRFDYIGRKDSQVKLNGQRVELGEINGAIEGSFANVQAATVPVKKEDGSMELYSFYVTDDNGLTKEKIIAEIKKTLPVYMLPSDIVRLDKMPMTATNKIDGMALKNIIADRSYVNNEVIASETCDLNGIADETAKSIDSVDPRDVINGNIDSLSEVEYVLSVWNSVLSIPVKSEDSSFFDVGGTSLAALTVLGKYYGDNFEMSLSDFYENPTVKQQAELLKSKNNASAVCLDIMDLEATEEKENIGKSVLISGATGFFGAHLVMELAERGCSDIICIVRDGNKDRLSEIFTYYFGIEKCVELMNTVTVLDGDISEDKLGMTDNDYSLLCENVCEIYHSAADVRHYASDSESYMKTNVGGTENMVELAKNANAKLYHISTCSVSGNSLKNSSDSVQFTENDFDIGQIWEKNIYVKSKYLAEKVVFDAISNGLNAKIFRLGRLVGREFDGKFQRNPESNAFYLTVKGFKQIGVLPLEVQNERIDLMPIDRCVKQVLLLKDADDSVYHIMNPIPPTLGEIMNTVNLNNRIVKMKDFYNVLKEQAPNLEGHLLGVVMDTVRSNAISKQITVTNTFTVESLKEKGYINEPVDVSVVLKEFN